MEHFEPWLYWMGAALIICGAIMGVAFMALVSISDMDEDDKFNRK